jgi:hypothetical protein
MGATTVLALISYWVTREEPWLPKTLISYFIHRKEEATETTTEVRGV